MKRISYFANKDETNFHSVLRLPRIIGEAGFTRHKIRAMKNGQQISDRSIGIHEYCGVRTHDQDSRGLEG